MKTNKRFSSEAQILKEIDRLKRQSRSCQVRADANLQWSESVFRSGEQELFEEAKDFKKRGLELRKLAASIDDHRLPKLGRKLAEIRTPIMPGILGDASISARL